MSDDIKQYHNQLPLIDRQICDQLFEIISTNLVDSNSKVWHAHPVWFIEGNPIVGYSKLKDNVRLLFWSGQSFDEPALMAEGSFKAAELRFTSAEQIDTELIVNFLHKAINIQWDYKNIVKNKGALNRLK